MTRRRFLKQAGFGTVAAVGFMIQTLPDDNHEGHSHNESQDDTTRMDFEGPDIPHRQMHSEEDIKTALSRSLRLLRQAFGHRT